MLLHSSNYSPVFFLFYYLLHFVTPFLREKNTYVPIARVASICRNSARRSSKKKSCVKNSAFFFCGALGRLGSAFTLKHYCSFTFPQNAPRQPINNIFYFYFL